VSTTARPATRHAEPATEDEPPEWYRSPADRVASLLDVDVAHGLGEDDAAHRLERYGPNRLADAPRRPWWLRFADQFRSVLVYILAGAAALALAVGDVKDPIVIGVVLLLNAVLGFVQETRAQGALDALRNMLSPTARVRRDGVVGVVDATELVPGDVVLLEAGERVPADGRVILSAGALVDESSLTGESAPVDKIVESIDSAAALPIGDRRNMVFMNTMVTAGRAECAVVGTGMDTEIGRVAHLLAETETAPTPLQRQIDRLGKRLAVFAIGAVAVVLALRLWRGDSPEEAVLAAVALAVAAIPEGLPAVVTVTLAVGVSQMAKRRAIVRRLPSVETLGATTVICSDKTGTLTQNEMTVRSLVVGGRQINVSGDGSTPRGRFSVRDGGSAPDVDRILTAGVLVNDAVVHDGHLVGDPTEAALVVAAMKAGVEVDTVRTDRPRIDEVPFDSATKFMVTVHRGSDGLVACMKGAPEAVLDRCDRWRDERGAVVELRSRCSEDAAALAAEGMRVLAVASAQRPDSPEAGVAPTQGFVLEGLVGMIDPVRPEARDAVGRCRAAGIDVKMITGDHPTTARAIAADVGIAGEVVDGAALDQLTDDELSSRVAGIGVFARVSPEHKLRVLRALQGNGEVAAMTGDGVNDAPALRGADIGVSMGVTGTEVAQQASDMVLADDNFATIVEAVRRGRAIYDNILSFVRFQLSTNMGAIATMLGAGVLGMPVPLAAMQLLWVNLIADGPPAMTLGVEPPARDVMERRPRSPEAPILTRERMIPMGLAAITMAVGTLVVYQWADGRYGAEVAQTMSFTTFVLFQMVNVMNVRSERHTAFRRDSLRNGKLWFAIAAVLVLQVLAVAWPPLQGVFDTTALTVGQWAIAAVVASSVLVVEEVRKAVSRRLDRAVQR
jgi:Ca2+-transporting ATPase